MKHYIYVKHWKELYFFNTVQNPPTSMATDHADCRILRLVAQKDNLYTFQCEAWKECLLFLLASYPNLLFQNSPSSIKTESDVSFIPQMQKIV